MRTNWHLGVFEAVSLLIIALTVLWMAALTAFAAARHAGML
jgi:hypothetical protein